MVAGAVEFRDRLVADFALPSRLGAFADLLDAALEKGYEIVSVEAFWTLTRAGAVRPEARYLILRHDVDTDPATAGEMLRIERERGVRGSYFFRISTLDRALIQDLVAAGAEVGYHYEELATLAKRRRARTATEARALLPTARRHFLSNIRNLRRLTGLALSSTASHGDWANRSTGVMNTEILADPGFRREARVSLEAYDAALKAAVVSEYSDAHPPRSWIRVAGDPDRPDPMAAFEAGDAVVYLLVHPRHWRSAREANLRDDLRRLAEGVLWRLPTVAELGRAVHARRPAILDAAIERWRRTVTVARAPRVRIALSGDASVEAVYRSFTAPHPRFRVTQAKRWGVALLPVPSDPDRDPAPDRTFRRNRQRALDAGYRATIVRAADHLADIVDVNRSAPTRQGRPMPEEYLDEATVARTIGADGPIHAVIDRDGHLRAYATGIPAGEAYILSYLIGHADHLAGGVMYLLLDEIVRGCAARRAESGAPAWIVADTFWGASRGLAYFKERAGFRPWTVTWAWAGADRPVAVDPAPAGPSADGLPAAHPTAGNPASPAAPPPPEPSEDRP